MKYEIYQCPISVRHCFMPYTDYLSNVNIKDYVLVYSGTVNSDDLEEIFHKHNSEYPDDYHARSMSSSDVIHVYDGKNEGWWYTDFIGFKKLDNFLDGVVYTR